MRKLLTLLALAIILPVLVHAQSIFVPGGPVPKFLTPSGDTTGAADWAKINAACTGAAIYLITGVYYINKPLVCSGPILANNADEYFMGDSFETVIKQASGTWVSGDAMIKPQSGVSAHYRGFMVLCSVSNGADGVNGFEFGGINGVQFDRVRARKCFNGYIATTGLAQIVSCNYCGSDTNQRWGFIVAAPASMSDFYMIEPEFSFNGRDTTFTGMTGGLSCDHCVGGAITNGDFEDNYSNSTAGFNACGINLANNVSAITIANNKFDQNVRGDICFTGTNSGDLNINGNFMTTGPLNTFTSSLCNIWVAASVSASPPAAVVMGGNWHEGHFCIDPAATIQGIFSDSWVLGWGCCVSYTIACTGALDQHAANVIGPQTVRLAQAGAVVDRNGGPLLINKLVVAPGTVTNTTNGSWAGINATGQLRFYSNLAVQGDILVANSAAGTCTVQAAVGPLMGSYTTNSAPAFNQEKWPSISITAASYSAGVVTFTTSPATGIAIAQSFVVKDMVPADYNGIYVAVTGTSGTTLKGIKHNPVISAYSTSDLNYWFVRPATLSVGQSFTTAGFVPSSYNITSTVGRIFTVYPAANSEAIGGGSPTGAGFPTSFGTIALDPGTATVMGQVNNGAYDPNIIVVADSAQFVGASYTVSGTAIVPTHGIATGLKTGGTYWVDFYVKPSAGTTCALTNANVTALEQ